MLLLAVGCAVESEPAGASGSALEDDYDAELPLVSFDDQVQCTLMPVSVVSGELTCVAKQGSTTAFPTLANGISVKATPAHGDPVDVIAARLRIETQNFPVKVEATLAGGKYGSDVTLTYDIGALTQDPNQSRTLEVPFKLFRAVVIAPGVESLSFKARGTGDVAPWTKAGSSVVTAAVEAKKSSVNGTISIPFFVPGSAADVSVSLQGEGIALDDVHLTRPGYYVLKDGQLRTAKASDLKAANITDPALEGLHRLKAHDEELREKQHAQDVQLCEKIGPKCNFVPDDCVQKLGRLEAAQRTAVFEQDRCRTSCDGMASCLAGDPN